MRRENDAGPREITEAEARRAGDELLDPANLDLFLTWHQLGGMERPPSLAEVAAMPATLRHDVLYLLREMGTIRRQRRKQQKQDERKRGKQR